MGDRIQAEPRHVDVEPDAAYLERDDGTAHLFWKARFVDGQLVVTTGVVGTPGEEKRTRARNAGHARILIRHRVLAQLARGFGYVLCGKAPDRVALPAVDARREAELAADPSDEALHVHADWLQERGDIRGELAALQHQPALAATAAQLLWEQRAYFYGPLAPYVTPDARAVVATWRAGWMDTLALGACAGVAPRMVVVADPAPLVALLPRVASARLLRALVIARPRFEGPLDFTTTVAALVEVLPRLPTLRRLTLGELDPNDSEWMANARLSGSDLGSLAPLWSVAGALASVTLRADHLTLGEIVLPAARAFRIETGDLAPENLAAIAGATWPNLETLAIWFGRTSRCDLAGVQPILDGNGLAKLRHLGLQNATFGDAIAAAIPRAKVLPQLETLDLSMSHITTEIIERAILPHARAFAHLRHLDLSRCLLDERGVQLAAQLAPSVNLAGQRNLRELSEDPEYRYAAVGG